MTEEAAETVLRREFEERYLRRCALMDLARMLFATGLVMAIIAVAVLIRRLLS